MDQLSLFDTAPDPWELDAAEEQQVAIVVFTDAPHGPYDYRVPDDFIDKLKPGQRIQVPLGKGNQLRTGYCVGIERKKVGTRALKSIGMIADPAPLLSPAMMKLTRWMADYYLCPWGQVLQGVIPSGVRGQAGTREMTFLEVPAAVKELLAKAPETVGKKTARIPLSADVILSAKQLDALRLLAASNRPLTAPELARIAKCTLAPINELRKKKLVHATVRRIQQMEIEEAITPRMTHLDMEADQLAALDAILKPLSQRRHETILIHGVTGSGKTEVYIRAIDEVIGFGRQAIVLVPEISLTPQTRERFRSRFEHVAVLHSHLSDSERHWHWQRISRGEVQVVVGARSAIFAPTPQLGLIVLDEEHDPSFKQGESPRYHAREVALQRARFENVPLVLGSATPALESWERTRRGEFTLVDMPRRVGDRPLPEVGTIDLRIEFREKAVRGSISRPLARAMEEALADGGQVILLLNRRGYSTHIQCPACGYVAKCPHCDLALTHHHEDEELKCHYCDFLDRPPAQCPDCKFDGIRYSGCGTERLEAEIRAKFRGHTVLRMDSDTMQKPGSHEKALDQFRTGAARILLGTQMIAKGLDFPNVTLVGVINADTALHFTDFRAAERTFQLVTQVAGRTGRGDKLGRVLVQTSSPEHPAIQAAVKHDYEMFATSELPDRLKHGYPPYATLIRLIVRSERDTLAKHYAEDAVERLRAACESAKFEYRLLGPAECPFAKLRGKFRFHALATSPDGETLRRVFGEVTSSLPSNEDVQWVVDVDPLDLL